MAAFRRGTLFVPSLVQCRHRGKINVRKPRQFYERRVFEAVTTVITPEMLKPKKVVCNRVENPVILEEHQNLYEEFQIRQCKKMFNEHKMIIVVQPAAMSGVVRYKIRNKLFHGGMEVMVWSNQIIRKAIQNTKYVNILPLIEWHNLYVVSKEENLASLIQTLKPFNEFIILGGIVEDRILTHADIHHYGSLGDLDTVRGQLCGILSSATSKTHQLLQSHQQQLTTNLAQYIRDRSSEPSS